MVFPIYELTETMPQLLQPLAMYDAEWKASQNVDPFLSLSLLRTLFLNPRYIFNCYSQGLDLAQAAIDSSYISLTFSSSRRVRLSHSEWHMFPKIIKYSWIYVI